MCSQQKGGPAYFGKCKYDRTQPQTEHMGCAARASAPARLNLSRCLWHNFVLLFISVLPYYIKLENFFRLNNKGCHRFILESLSKEACRQAVGPQGVDKLRSGIGAGRSHYFAYIYAVGATHHGFTLKVSKTNADELW